MSVSYFSSDSCQYLSISINISRPDQPKYREDPSICKYWDNNALRKRCRVARRHRSTSANGSNIGPTSANPRKSFCNNKQAKIIPKYTIQIIGASGCHYFDFGRSFCPGSSSDVVREYFWNKDDFYEFELKRTSLIRINFEDSEVLTVTKDAKITLPDMIGNIGGTLGVFIGFSFLGLLDYVIDQIDQFMQRRN